MPSDIANPAASSLALLILRPLLNREAELSALFWDLEICCETLKLLEIEFVMGTSIYG